jgi:hypothetical protein
VGDMLSYLCEERPWCKKIITIAHNTKAFDLHFILNRAIFFKMASSTDNERAKIMCMTMEHLKFIDSICFLPFPLRKLSAALGLTASKSWYPHFNTTGNLDYVGELPAVKYYGVEEMGVSERAEFFAGTKNKSAWKRSSIPGRRLKHIVKTALLSYDKHARCLEMNSRESEISMCFRNL